MIPVDTILQVEQHYNSLGFSVLYNPIYGNQPERKTFLFVRDAEGNIVGSIFDRSENVLGVIL